MKATFQKQVIWAKCSHQPPSHAAGPTRPEAPYYPILGEIKDSGHLLVITQNNHYHDTLLDYE